MSSRSLIDRLQAEALDNDVSVSSLLRVTKVIAAMLDHDEFLGWANRELNGYQDVSASDLPEYRKLYGRLMALLPYGHIVPVVIKDANVASAVSQYPVFTGIEEIERSITTRGDERGVKFILSPGVKGFLLDLFPGERIVEFINEVPSSALAAIGGHVRNAVLDWSLRLRKAGVSGAGLSFGEKDKERARGVMQNFFNSDVAFANHAGAGAHVALTQGTSAGVINANSLSEALPLLRDAMAALPEDLRQIAIDTISRTEAELVTPVPDTPKLRRLLAALAGVAKAAGASVFEATIAFLTEKFLNGS
jgi:AbiTii